MSRLLDRPHEAQGLYLVASEQAGLVRGCAAAAAAAGEFFSREHFFFPSGITWRFQNRGNSSCHSVSAGK